MGKIFELNVISQSISDDIKISIQKQLVEFFSKEKNNAGQIFIFILAKANS